MTITDAGLLLLLPVIILFIFFRFDRAYFAMVIASAFTTVTIFYLGEDNILLFHILFFICCVKFMMCTKAKLQIRKGNLLLYFIVYCGISMLFSFYNKDVVVININGVLTNIEPSSQQITQYMYLLIGFVTYLITSYVIRNYIAEAEEVEKYIDIAYLVILIIGNLQPYIPTEITNTYLRNTFHIDYAEQTSRISATFGEPSFLSLYLTPLFACTIYRILKKFRYVYLLCILLNLRIILENNSSSFYLGMIFALFFFAVFWFREKKYDKNKIISLLVLFTLVIAGLFFFSGQELMAGLYTLYDKLNGNQGIRGTSGYIRNFSFQHHVQVFLDHFILGVGYGTVRSNDLFSTYLAEIGLIGNLLFYGYIGGILYKLLLRKSELCNRLILLIGISLGILLIAVPEIYMLFIWIYLGLAEGILYRKEEQQEGVRVGIHGKKFDSQHHYASL